ncbi:MAG: hypothetical protein M0Q15_16055 [Nevskia sp.]|jgi:hypothetical protein|nr:hypothetical protein [Nevskia sp.]
MSTSFKFFHDAALTQEITADPLVNPLTASQYTDGSLGAVDKLIYFGSAATGMKAQLTADPGVGAIVVSIVDADGGTGAPDSEFKLALSSGGLATAVAGAALTLSHTINSEVANAIPIYTRRASALTSAGSYTDLTLQTQDLTESPV